MEIEDVARIGFAAWRTAQQQRNLAVGHGVLRQIVVHHQRMLAVVAEVLADGGGRVGRQIQERRGLGGRGGDDDGVAHGAGFGQRLHNLRDRRALLADGAVDADQVVLGIVDDGVKQDGGLAGLTVANDQLALAAADGNHGVDGLEAGGHGLAPLSSMGMPSALTTRPIMASPTGTERIFPVRLTSLPSLSSV